MEKHDVRGVVIAVRLPDGSVFDYPIGHDARGTQVTGKTLFRVASITKLATALAVLRLVTRDTLALDQTLEQWLEKHPATELGARLRDVLAHVGGLPFSWKDKGSPLEAGAAAPGARFEYSNAGYDLLGMVIEQSAEQSYDALIRSEVLDPLGVSGAMGRVPAAAHIAAVYGREEEYLNWSDLRKKEWPSGGLVASALDVVHLIGGFAFPPAGFLREGLLREAMADATGEVDHPQYPTDPSAAWGLGPEIRGRKDRCFGGSHVGRDSFGHYGGSGCVVWHDPATTLTWSILNTKTVGAARAEERDDWAYEFWGDIADKIVPLTIDKIRSLNQGT